MRNRNSGKQRTPATLCSFGTSKILAADYRRTISSSRSKRKDKIYVKSKEVTSDHGWRHTSFPIAVSPVSRERTTALSITRTRASLAISGNNPRATLFGVYWLIRQLGVSFLAPEFDYYSRLGGR